MKRLPFDKPGSFRKGNIHTHSTASDGELTPDEVCRRYREAGYDFLAITDHFLEQFNYPIVDTRPFRTDEFTTIIAAELHAPIPDSVSKWDIVRPRSAPRFCPVVGRGAGSADRRPRPRRRCLRHRCASPSLLSDPR